MGNDIDVCSKDDDLDRQFIEAYGPQDEVKFIGQVCGCRGARVAFISLRYLTIAMSRSQGTLMFLRRTFFRFTETIKVRKVAPPTSSVLSS